MLIIVPELQSGALGTSSGTTKANLLKNLQFCQVFLKVAQNGLGGAGGLGGLGLTDRVIAVRWSFLHPAALGPAGSGTEFHPHRDQATPSLSRTGAPAIEGAS